MVVLLLLQSVKDLVGAELSVVLLARLYSVLATTSEADEAEKAD